MFFVGDVLFFAVLVACVWGGFVVYVIVREKRKGRREC